MLILPHADGLGIDFYQLSQRILQSSRDGSRASLAHVKLRKFLRGKLAGGIDRRARLVHNHILDRHVQLFNQLHNHLLGLSGCRPVPDGNQGYVVFFDQLFQLRLRLFHLILGRGRINYLRVQHFSRLIHNRQLTACAESRIPAKHDFTLDGRLQ